MIVIALDLSTSSGIAVFKDGKLIDHHNVTRKVKGNPQSPNYPFNYIDMAEDIALRIVAGVFKYSPDFVVIEETNKGKERHRQKQLEFIHFAVANAIRKLEIQPKLRYMDTSAWRKILSIGLDTEQRVQNRDRKKERDSKRQEIYEGIKAQMSPRIESAIYGLGKRESNKIKRKWERDIKVLVGQEMKKFRSPTKGINSKTLSVNYVNENFGLNFKMKDNDIADAICVGLAFIKNNYSTITAK